MYIYLYTKSQEVRVYIGLEVNDLVVLIAAMEKLLLVGMGNLVSLRGKKTLSYHRNRSL